MAGPGYTFIEGINELVEAVGEFPMSGATKPSGGGDTASIYYLAERHIDRWNTRVQHQGWPENTDFSVEYLPSGANHEVVLASNVLKIRAAGPSDGRMLVLRVDTADINTPKVWDATQASFDVGDDPIYLDRVVELAFENCTPELQDVILAEAKASFQLVRQGNMQMDAALSADSDRAGMRAARSSGEAVQPFNAKPIVPQQRRTPQQ